LPIQDDPFAHPVNLQPSPRESVALLRQQLASIPVVPGPSRRRFPLAVPVVPIGSAAVAQLHAQAAAVPSIPVVPGLSHHRVLPLAVPVVPVGSAAVAQLHAQAAAVPSIPIVPDPLHRHILPVAVPVIPPVALAQLHAQLHAQAEVIRQQPAIPLA
jgi:hypothetical protein